MNLINKDNIRELLISDGMDEVIDDIIHSHPGFDTTMCRIVMNELVAAVRTIVDKEDIAYNYEVVLEKLEKVRDANSYTNSSGKTLQKVFKQAMNLAIEVVKSGRITVDDEAMNTDELPEWKRKILQQFAKGDAHE